MADNKQLPDDPKDHYIQNTRLSLRELAELYEGRRGCSFRNLKDRSYREKWSDLRYNRRKSIEKKTIENIAAAQADEVVSTLKRLNTKHLERIEWLYKLNEQYIKQRIVKKADGSTECSMDMGDIRKAVQNMKELMELERLVNNLPMNKPGEEITEQKASEMIDKLSESAQRDWAGTEIKSEPDED